MNLHDKVKYILDHFPITRNDDLALSIRVWVEFYQLDAIEAQKLFYQLKQFPAQDVIKRIRAYIQNKEGQFLPTNDEVLKLRRRSKKDKTTEQEWKMRVY